MEKANKLASDMRKGTDRPRYAEAFAALAKGHSKTRNGVFGRKTPGPVKENQ